MIFRIWTDRKCVHFSKFMYICVFNFFYYASYSILLNFLIDILFLYFWSQTNSIYSMIIYCHQYFISFFNLGYATIFTRHNFWYVSEKETNLRIATLVWKYNFVHWIARLKVNLFIRDKKKLCTYILGLLIVIVTLYFYFLPKEY